MSDFFVEEGARFFLRTQKPVVEPTQPAFYLTGLDTAGAGLIPLVKVRSQHQPGTFEPPVKETYI